MLEWSLKKIDLPLKFPWKIARGTSLSKTNFIVTVECDGSRGQGEVAFNIRYNESEKLIEEQFQLFLDHGAEDISSLEKLIALVSELDLACSLSFGLESAMAHLNAQMSDRTIHQLLCVPQVHGIHTSFSLPMMEPSQIEKFISEHKLSRFAALKIKIGSEGALEVIQEVRKFYKGPLRLDANEAYDDPSSFLNLTEKLKDVPIQFIEQPFPAKNFEMYREIKSKSGFLIFADESLTSGEVTPEFKDLFDGVNVKLMKAGGYMRGLKQLRTARELGLKTMLGCMVETSLGISSAMNIANNVDFYDLDGCLLISSDPFNAIQEDNGTLNYNYVI
ncbi:MAG: dipeptide epimerase [Bdellovibrionales bacterium CG12_big_fil_rev_8_21_14_0_65_38_15]|nr:MAG: dipeptide epimerase [Bdellovibrionales bacterium CG22_combo_CG10-13_8_21_14_all_38_13]PIQ54030.1 MAG: dipeptide epimerase [Bdellovibrionales bacterium CG12_big_fil_rev_8_21_14_0_65_38_15]PIR28555.1 MAG: dipeptide epimerase [Bdellovibrionales bacterium CG11_big_fil_rev_8_21_14_0_20_38_13]